MNKSKDLSIEMFHIKITVTLLIINHKEVIPSVIDVIQSQGNKMDESATNKEGHVEV